VSWFVHKSSGKHNHKTTASGVPLLTIPSAIFHLCCGSPSLELQVCIPQGIWSICQQSNLWSVNPQTGRLVDMAIRKLVNLQTRAVRNSSGEITNADFGRQIKDNILVVGFSAVLKSLYCIYSVIVEICCFKLVTIFNVNG